VFQLSKSTIIPPLLPLSSLPPQSFMSFPESCMVYCWLQYKMSFPESCMVYYWLQYKISFPASCMVYCWLQYKISFPESCMVYCWLQCKDSHWVCVYHKPLHKEHKMYWLVSIIFIHLLPIFYTCTYTHIILMSAIAKGMSKSVFSSLDLYSIALFTAAISFSK